MYRKTPPNPEHLIELIGKVSREAVIKEADLFVDPAYRLTVRDYLKIEELLRLLIPKPFAVLINTEPSYRRICPNCRERLSLNFQELEVCQNCGQHIIGKTFTPLNAPEEETI